MSLDYLSKRQREVVVRVGRGMTNKQIARDLCISHRTVEAHVKDAYVKLGVKGRVALALAVHGIRIDSDGQA